LTAVSTSFPAPDTRAGAGANGAGADDDAELDEDAELEEDGDEDEEDDEDEDDVDVPAPEGLIVPAPAVAEPTTLPATSAALDAPPAARPAVVVPVGSPEPAAAALVPPAVGVPSTPMTTGEPPFEADAADEASSDTGCLLRALETTGTASARTPTATPTSTTGSAPRVRRGRSHRAAAATRCSAARRAADRGGPAGVWCTGKAPKLSQWGRRYFGETSRAHSVTVSGV
jgi:hypothetical protein